MKIKFISDIHLDKKNKNIKRFIHYLSFLNKNKPDVLILGGDYFIGNTRQLEKFLKIIEENIEFPAVFVLGNHDILNKDMYYLFSDLKEKFNNKLVFLENETIRIKDKKIYGSIGFVDWSSNELSSFDMKKLNRKEFRTVYYKGKLITPKWMKDYHEKCLDKIVEEQPDIVVTHFPLIKEPFMPFFDFRKPMSSYRTNDNWNILKKCKTTLFINGHVHQKIFYTKKNKIFVSNPMMKG